MFIFISLATIINNPEKQTKVLVSKLRILKVKRDNPNRSIHRTFVLAKMRRKPIQVIIMKEIIPFSLRKKKSKL
jgi:hypothetical protein